MKKIEVNIVADSGAATASLEPNESRLAGNTRTRNKGLLSRLQARGPEALSDAELVAVVLAVPVEKAADMVRDVSAPPTAAGRNASRMSAHKLCCESPFLFSRSSETEPRDGRIFFNSPHNTSPLHITGDSAGSAAEPSSDDFSSTNPSATPEVSLEDLRVSAPARSPHIETGRIAAKFCACAPNWCEDSAPWIRSRHAPTIP